MGNNNQARWEVLCQKYKKFLERNNGEAFRLSRLAVHLRSVVAIACGCNDNYVFHYTYEHGPEIKYDKYEKVQSGLSSIIRGEKSWVFGLGVQLEAAPSSHPKTTIVFPIEAEVRGESFIIESTLLSEAIHVRSAQEYYESDLNVLADKVFEGLSRALEEKDPSKKFGFAI